MSSVDFLKVESVVLLSVNLLLIPATDLHSVSHEPAGCWLHPQTEPSPRCIMGVVGRSLFLFFPSFLLFFLGFCSNLRHKLLNLNPWKEKSQSFSRDFFLLISGIFGDFFTDVSETFWQCYFSMYLCCLNVFRRFFLADSSRRWQWRFAAVRNKRHCG